MSLDSRPPFFPSFLLLFLAAFLDVFLPVFLLVVVPFFCASSHQSQVIFFLSDFYFPSLRLYSLPFLEYTEPIGNLESKILIYQDYLDPFWNL